MIQGSQYPLFPNKKRTNYLVGKFYEIDKYFFLKKLSKKNKKSLQTKKAVLSLQSHLNNSVQIY